MSGLVYTIGHSNRSTADLLDLLRMHNITAVADVRSQPFSRIHPHFNQPTLEASLFQAGIRYVFLGKELGARSSDPSCYEGGKVQYDRLARTPLFQRGLDRLVSGISKRFSIALLCAEKDPLMCHRAILVARHLVARGIEVNHIVENGFLESHDQALRRLMQMISLSSMHMFRTERDLVDIAYDIQGERIAFTNDSQSGDSSGDRN